MNKILPINVSPSIRSYVHHSYVNAILQNDKLMKVYVQDIIKRSWNIIPNDISWNCCEYTNTIDIKDNPNRQSTVWQMNRICEKNDELVVCIKDVKIVNPLTYVKITLGNHDVHENNEAECFFVKWNQYNININEKLINYDNHMYSYYKVSVQEEKITISISNDEVHWVVIQEGQYNMDMCYFYIGIFFGENQYNAWKYMNYIQLFYNENDYNTVYLDHYIFPRKGFDASYNCQCQFIDTEYLDITNTISVYKGLVNYLMSCIDDGYYINVSLQEYYVEGRDAYEKFHYSHFNLVYGYDDVKRELYLFGYKGDGTVTSTNIPFDMIEKAIESYNIVRYKYSVNSVIYKFNIQFVKQAISEYVFGADSSIKYAGILSQCVGTYGMKIFDKLSGQGKDLLMKDKRISYVLYEHCAIMRERLEYMIKNEFVDKEATNELLNKCDSMVKDSEILKNLVLKNKVKHKYQDRIVEQLERLNCMQKNFYMCLLDSIIG